MCNVRVSIIRHRGKRGCLGLVLFRVDLVSDGLCKMCRFIVSFFLFCLMVHCAKIAMRGVPSFEPTETDLFLYMDVERYRTVRR